MFFVWLEADLNAILQSIIRKVQTNWLGKSSIHHQIKACQVTGRPIYDILIKNEKVIFFLWNTYGWIVHNEICSMHLENR